MLVDENVWAVRRKWYAEAGKRDQEHFHVDG